MGLISFFLHFPCTAAGAVNASYCQSFHFIQTALPTEGPPPPSSAWVLIRESRTSCRIRPACHTPPPFSCMSPWCFSHSLLRDRSITLPSVRAPGNLAATVFPRLTRTLPPPDTVFMTTSYCWPPFPGSTREPHFRYLPSHRFYQLDHGVSSSCFLTILE